MNNRESPTKVFGLITIEIAKQYTTKTTEKNNSNSNQTLKPIQKFQN